jgi:hypothetical protein
MGVGEVVVVLLKILLQYMLKDSQLATSGFLAAVRTCSYVA